MHYIDKRVLRLVDLLIFEKKIKNATEFCAEIEIQKQNFSKIKKGEARFTIRHIEKVCKKYNVNSNWILGIEKKVFRTAESIEITNV
jgi:DNA-binding Xre family transcriptional regulator